MAATKRTRNGRSPQSPQAVAVAPPPDTPPRPGLARRFRWVAWLLVGILAAGLIFFNAILPQLASHALLKVGDAAPEIHLSDDRGIAHDVFADAGARPILVEFFETDCTPCRRDVPTVCKIVGDHPDTLVVAVETSNHSAADVATFRRETGSGCFTGTLLVDPGSSVTHSYNILDTPTAYLIKNGRIAAAGVGDDGLTAVAGQIGAAAPH